MLPFFTFLLLLVFYYSLTYTYTHTLIHRYTLFFFRLFGIKKKYSNLLSLTNLFIYCTLDLEGRKISNELTGIEIPDNNLTIYTTSGELGDITAFTSINTDFVDSVLVNCV